MKLEELKRLVEKMCDVCDRQDPHSHASSNYSGEKKASGGKMARTDLVTIARDAQELLNMFGDDAELPDWVESKLTKASDYLNSVRKYIGGEIVRQQTGLMENTNAAKLARKKQDIEAINEIMLNKMQASEVQGLLMTLERDYDHVGGSGEEGGLMEGSSPRQEEQMHALASAATSGMARLKDPAGVHPTVLDYFFENKEDKMGFLDAFHLEIRRELEREIDYEEKFAKENPTMADKLKKGEEQPSLGLQEDREVYLYIEDATYDDGSIVEEDFEFWSDVIEEAEYRGRKVKLNKPMRGDVKKFKVFVKDPKTGNVKKVNYGDPNMRIKKSSPKRRKSFRARHNCDNPGPKTKARYWSCKKW
jgi:hypothetical protein